MSNTTNNKKNEDPMNIIWGDCPSIKCDDECRIVLQNVNGLNSSYNCAKATAMTSDMDSIGADIIGLVETNTNWNFSNIREQTYGAWRKFYEQTKISVSSSDIHFDSAYQPGGTMTVVGSPLSSRTKVNSDKSGLGRWSEAVITGKNIKKVAIITAYGVGKNKIGTCGPQTCFFQQWTILNKQNFGTRIDPRERLFEDLKNTIMEYRNNGTEVIVMMDANDTLQNPNSKFTNWVRECQLYDPLLELHGTDEEPATYARGKNRIDYILTSESLLGYVTGAGILPIHELTISDHRALFMDIDLKRFFDGEIFDAMNFNGRDLSTYDPRTVIKYQQLLLDELNKSTIENEIDDINEYLKTNPINDSIKRSFNKIDDELTKMKLRCEKKSKQKYKHPWSPALKKAYRNFQFWNVWLSEKRLSKKKRGFKQSTISNKKIDLLAQRMKYSDDENSPFINSCDSKTINSKIKEAKKRLKEIREKAREHRNEYLKLQAETYNNQGCKDLAKLVKAIQSREYRRRTFRKLRGVMGKLKSGGLDHVLKQREDGSEERINDKDLMYEAIIKRNIKHFSQADGTPFTTDPLKSLIGPTATNDFCEKILSGQIDVDGMDIEEAAKTILKNLVRKNDLTIIDQSISEDDLIEGYKKWNENTSTSPSGCHLGHEKALLKRIREQEIESEISGKLPLYRRIFKITAQKINWAIKHGHVYERWKKVVNAMIEKIPGKPLLNKLRIIHLLESDFNLMIGILWGRRLVYNGEDNDLFDDGQSGSRPGKRCQELLTKKDATLAIWRMSRTDGIFFDNDAKSCFDRIVMTMASICSQHFGMPKEPCEVFLNTLQEMKYHIKTSFGTSESSYSATPTSSVHGPGQGGRGSPCIWLAISSLIMKCARLKTDGATLYNPFDANETTSMSITGFVDDVTHWISNISRDIIEQLVDIQIIAQWWEQLLYTTGGKLELSKCFLYVLKWEFNGDGRPYITKPKNLPISVEIIDSETKLGYTIAYKSCDEPHRSLGVLNTPNGSNKAEFQRLTKKSQEFAQRISISNISRGDAKTLYFSFYIPSMLYSLCIGSFSFNQCQKIQGVTTQKFLSRMGFNRCLPSAVVYANRDCGGIGLRHLYSEQGTEKICHIIQTLRANTQTGDLLKMRLLWAHRLAGIKKPVLEDTETWIPQVDDVDPWITSLREFLFNSELKLKIMEFNDIAQKCKNDQFIMEIASRSMTKAEIIRVNNCRLYLKAITISDISSADGTTISNDAYWCKESAILQSSGLWPKQTKPGKKSIAIWQKLLDTITEVESLKLEDPLGEWIKKPTEVIETSATVYFDISTKQVVKQVGSEWKKGIGRYKRRGFKIYGWIQALPAPLITNLIPAENINNHSSDELITWRKVKVNPQRNCTIATWRELVSTKEGWEHQLLSECQHLHGVTLESMISTNKVIQVFTNATTSDNEFSYGWISFNGETKTGNASGKPVGSKLSLHRTELFAILSWVKMTTYLCMVNKVSLQCNVILYVTSKTIVKELHEKFDINCMKNNLIDDYDIINEIKILVKQLSDQNNKKIEVRIVKHKKKKNKDELSIIQKRSLMVKEMTKQYLVGNESNIEFNMLIESSKAYVVSGSKALTGEVKKTARWKWSEFMLQDYYCEKFQISLEELHTIDWSALKAARGKMNPSLQTFSIKYVIDWLPTGSRLEMIQGDLVTNCIHCGMYEDAYHLLQCLKRKDSIATTIEKFSKALDEHKTDPRIKRTMLFQIARWFREEKQVPFSNIQAHHTAIKEQEAIGWHNFTKGLWSQQWRLLQEKYEERHNIKNNRWAAKMILWWVQLGHEVWMDRNEKIHDETNALTSRAHEEVVEQIRMLYELENEVSMNDRDIFEMSLEKRISYSTKSLQIWVKNMKNRIYNSIKNQQVVIAQGQQSIINWLRGESNNNNENNNEGNDNDEDEDNALNPSIHTCGTENITISKVDNQTCPGPILAED